MESIEKLRESISAYAANCDEDWLYRCADEIEREVSERYMLLPVDAEEVPIRVGSKVVYSDGTTRTVMAVTDDGACLDTIEHYGRLRLHVVKPRTIEDVLREFAEGAEHGKYSNALIAKYADELRSMGVGE